MQKYYIDSNCKCESAMICMNNSIVELDKEKQLFIYYCPKCNTVWDGRELNLGRKYVEYNESKILFTDESLREYYNANLNGYENLLLNMEDRLRHVKNSDGSKVNPYDSVYSFELYIEWLEKELIQLKIAKNNYDIFLLEWDKIQILLNRPKKYIIFTPHVNIPENGTIKDKKYEIYKGRDWGISGEYESYYFLDEYGKERRVGHMFETRRCKIVDDNDNILYKCD